MDVLIGMDTFMVNDLISKVVLLYCGLLGTFAVVYFAIKFVRRLSGL